MGFVGNILGVGTRSTKKSISSAEQELKNFHSSVGERVLNGGKVDSKDSDAINELKRKIENAKKEHKKAVNARTRDIAIAGVPTIGAASLYVSNKRMDDSLREE
jgi:ElaB/YqjD/DUF883 family membrane-anchored ribosome-binding protein